MIRRKNPYRALEKAIGYRFRRKGLLETALLHRSYRFENEGISVDNQRLEFLGDAALDLVAAVCLFRAFPEEQEGVLTAYRSQLTSGKALARFASEIDLGEHLRLGKGERLTGGHQRESTLADALESVLGAAYLDGDLKAVMKIFERVFMPHLERLQGDVWAHNPKGRLQEFAQRHWKGEPRYNVIKKKGPAHAAVFTVGVELPDGSRAVGEGRNKQTAEAGAATHLLEQLDEAGRL